MGSDYINSVEMAKVKSSYVAMCEKSWAQLGFKL